MKPVVYFDRRGFARRMLIRDQDDDSQAEYGVPAGVPDVEHELDWEEIIRGVNNILVLDNVQTFYDLQRMDSINKIANVVKRAVYAFYRLEVKRNNNGHQ